MADFIEVSKVEDGTRLLRWFLRHFPGMPQREFYKLCRGGQIRVNSKRVRGTEILCMGDAVRIPPTVASYANVQIKKTESGENFVQPEYKEIAQGKKPEPEPACTAAAGNTAGCRQVGKR